MLREQNNTFNHAFLFFFKPDWLRKKKKTDDGRALPTGDASFETSSCCLKLRNSIHSEFFLFFPIHPSKQLSRPEPKKSMLSSSSAKIALCPINGSLT
jgi:hypothetical protein